MNKCGHFATKGGVIFRNFVHKSFMDGPFITQPLTIIAVALLLHIGYWLK